MENKVQTAPNDGLVVPNANPSAQQIPSCYPAIDMKEVEASIRYFDEGGAGIPQEEVIAQIAAARKVSS